MDNEVREKRGEDRAESEMRKVADKSMKNRKKSVFKEMKNNKEIVTVGALWLRKTAV